MIGVVDMIVGEGGAKNGLNVMPSGTAVPFIPYSAPHLGAIPNLIRPMHTENTGDIKALTSGATCRRTGKVARR